MLLFIWGGVSSYQYVCKHDTRFSECTAQIVFSQHTAIDPDSGELINGWTARVPRGTKLLALPPSPDMPMVTLPYFPVHCHGNEIYIYIYIYMCVCVPVSSLWQQPANQK